MSDTQIADKDKVRAQELHQKILIHAQLVAQNLWEMCSSLKEMRDSKLYYQLGYMHFDDYCQNELGIKRRQAYKYISIAENSSMNFVHSSAQIGVTKLALLASISEGEREQLMEQTDVESVTVRELKEQIKGLQDRITHQSKFYEQQESRLADEREASEQLQSELDRARLETEAEKKRNAQLTAELEDLRNNPLPEDKYRIAAKKHDKDMMEFREQADRDLHDERQKRWDLQEQFDDFRKKQQDIIKDMERQLREAKDRPPAVIEVNSTVSMFNAYFEIARDALYSAINHAMSAAEPEPLYTDLEDLFDTFIELIKEQREGTDNDTV